MSYFTQMGCIKLNGGIIHASTFTKVKFHTEDLGRCYRVGLFSTDCMDHSYLDITTSLTSQKLQNLEMTTFVDVVEMKNQKKSEENQTFLLCLILPCTQ